MNAHVHTAMHTPPHTNTFTHSCPHMHARTHTGGHVHCAHTQAGSCAYPCAHVRTHVHTCAPVHACTPTHTCKDTHHAHEHVHTQSCARTHTCTLLSFVARLPSSRLPGARGSGKARKTASSGKFLHKTPGVCTRPNTSPFKTGPVCEPSSILTVERLRWAQTPHRKASSCLPVWNILQEVGAEARGWGCRTPQSSDRLAARLRQEARLWLPLLPASYEFFLGENWGRQDTAAVF